MQEMAGKENLPCDGHPRGPGADLGAQPDRNWVAGLPAKAKAPPGGSGAL